MNTREESRSAIKVVGINVRTSNINEKNPESALIPGLWQQFFSDNVEGQIPNKVEDGCIYGVYTHYDSDHKGEYTLYAGHEVENLTSVPEGMYGIEIPAGKYLVFSEEGQIPDVIYVLWEKIWKYFAENSLHKRAFTTDFECYCKEDSPRMEIYIAIV